MFGLNGLRSTISLIALTHLLRDFQAAPQDGIHLSHSPFCVSLPTLRVCCGLNVLQIYLLRLK